ncbi:MAG: iron-containing redox enzyme family protein [Ignavibacteria bacterium]|nr:iron-containing redox enzyme family protein [Ignavibacteria bacterium]
MTLRKKLLDHPFYRAWTDGKITNEQLAVYADAYLGLIEKIPYFWEKSAYGIGADNAETKEVLTDELSHILLWKNWSDKLTVNGEKLNLNDIVSELDNMNASELLGAIHSFEVQQPEVAKTKKDGLIKFYGFDNSDLKYFDEHMNEEKHIKFGADIAKHYADAEDFKNGFEKGSELFYNGLDRFLN